MKDVAQELLAMNFFRQKSVPTKYIGRSKHHHGESRGVGHLEKSTEGLSKEYQTINAFAKRPRHHEN